MRAAGGLAQFNNKKPGSVYSVLRIAFRHLTCIQMMRLFLPLLFCLVMAGPAGAQQEPRPPKAPPRLQVGVGFYGLLYQGDLTPGDEWAHRVYPGFVANLQFEGPRFLSPQLNGGFGRVVAQDRNLANAQAEGATAPNTFVSTRFFHFDLVVRARFLRRRNFRPHVGIGAGLMNFTPSDRTGESLINQQNTRNATETYSTTGFYFPIVAGFTVRLNDFASLGLEYKRYALTNDYFDNVAALGTRTGNDRLHAAQLTLLLTPGAKLRLGRGERR